MKKLNYLLALIVIFLSSCATYNYQTTSSDEAFAKVYCKNPEYKGTVVAKVYDVKIINKTYAVDTGEYVESTFDTYKPIDLTISSLTLEAQSKFGKDVTISNVRWDIETSTAFFIFTTIQKVGATYDVIICK